MGEIYAPAGFALVKTIYPEGYIYAIQIYVYALMRQVIFGCYISTKRTPCPILETDFSNK